jgi:hypothetical protein
MRVRTGIITQPKLIGIDVVRTRSTESTESVNASTKTPKSIRVPSQRTPEKERFSWRTKDIGSIFRSPPSPSSSQEIPDMFTIRRSLAFDEDDEEAT